MIGNINDADYVVLGNTTSKTFPDLLAQTTAADKLPLRSAFISDCVKHEALLDDSDYILEDFIPQPKKRGRPGMAIAKAETPKKKVPKEKKPPKKSDEQMAPISYDGPPSPTPPPVSSRVELPSGYFRFSEEDIAFFRLYARHLVEQDHLISNTSLFKRLHEKVSSSMHPHYTNHIVCFRCHIIRPHRGNSISVAVSLMIWIIYAKKLALPDAKPLIKWRFKMKLVHPRGPN